MEATSEYNIKAHKGAKLYLGLRSDLSASGLAIHMIFLPVFAYILRQSIMKLLKPNSMKNLQISGL